MDEVVDVYSSRIDALNKELSTRAHHILEAMPILNERHRLHQELAEIARICRPWNYVSQKETPQ